MSSAAKRALRKIAELIDGIDADYLVRRKFKRLVSEVCLSHGITDIDRGERIHFARRLLDEKAPRAVIKDRLIARYEVSRSQAYRIIATALQLSHRST